MRQTCSNHQLWSFLAIWMVFEPIHHLLIRSYGVSFMSGDAKLVRPLLRNEGASHYHLEVQANPPKIAQKNDAIFSIYGRNGINPWHFFLILTWAFRGRWGQRRPPSEGGRFWGWKIFFTKTKKLAFQLCFPWYGIFPTRNALKLTFVFFQFQLLAPAMYYIIPI